MKHQHHPTSAAASYNLPQEAPEAFAGAVLDVAKLSVRSSRTVVLLHVTAGRAVAGRSANRPDDEKGNGPYRPYSRRGRRQGKSGAGLSYLKKNGLRTGVAADGRQMRSFLDGNTVDLIVLDVMMPGDDGLVPCRELRAGKHKATPNADADRMTRDDEMDRIIGLEMGATTTICLGTLRCPRTSCADQGHPAPHADAASPICRSARPGSS